MAKAKKLNLNLNFKPNFRAVTEQFQGLNGRPPGLWPVLPRSLLLVGIFALVLVAAYFGYIRGQVEELNNGKAAEKTLKDEYSEKIKKAVNLPLLVRQKEEVDQYVTALEKQLPSKAEMDQLLKDINQAGTGRGLQFELFKPDSVALKEHYAELPIQVEVFGLYHSIGSFTSDIANLPRIVTLNNLAITQEKDKPLLKMKATVKTFRYLDKEERDAVRREALKKTGGQPQPNQPAAGGQGK